MDYSTNIKPWEAPRIKRIVELFGGRVVQIKQISTKVEVKPSEIER